MFYIRISGLIIDGYFIPLFCKLAPLAPLPTSTLLPSSLNFVIALICPTRTHSVSHTCVCTALTMVSFPCLSPASISASGWDCVYYNTVLYITLNLNFLFLIRVTLLRTCSLKLLTLILHSFHAITSTVCTGILYFDEQALKT